jgi:hypothetical protein
MKKNHLLLIITLLLTGPVLACPLCAKQQPKGFANITHGVGPGGWFDFAGFFWLLMRPDNARSRARRQQVSFS